MLGLGAAIVLPLLLESAPPAPEPSSDTAPGPAAGERSGAPSQIRIATFDGGDGGAPPVRLGESDGSEAAPRSGARSGGGAGGRLAVGWAVQIGSFADPDNARKLRDQVASQGFRAFTEQVESRDGKPRVRVLVGPDVQRSAASGRLSRLQREASIEGFLVRYPG